MKTIATLKSGKQLWGIYHTDLEHARDLGDPHRTVVGAPTNLIAEETAARLGFRNPGTHPVTFEERGNALWLHKRCPGPRQELAHKPSRGIRI